MPTDGKKRRRPDKREYSNRLHKSEWIMLALIAAALLLTAGMMIWQAVTSDSGPDFIQLEGMGYSLAR